jgi:AbrB family looped-hinge helix DNA binding protein
MAIKGIVTSKGQLVIPAKLRQQYNIRAGTRVRFVAIKNGIGVYPQYPEQIDSARGMLAGLGLPADIERDPEREIR